MTPLYSDDTRWKRLKEILDGWIGTPYRHYGSKKTGADCGLWIAHVFKDAGVVQSILSAQFYSRQWYNKEGEGVLLGSLRTYCQNMVSDFVMREESAQQSLLRGDILVFQLPKAKCPNHCGIYLGMPRPKDPFMIHCLEGSGMHTMAMRSSWNRFLVTLFRIYNSD